MNATRTERSKSFVIQIRKLLHDILHDLVNVIVTNGS